MNKDLTVQSNSMTETTDTYRQAYGLAKSLCQSGLIPDKYKNNPANCMVAIELADRLNTGVLMIMQNLNVIKGNPSFGSKFLIGLINNSDEFGRLKFEYQNEGQEKKCRAFTELKETGDILYGQWVSMKMAQAEGWSTRSGSKWKTMPDMMLMYRSAAFWTRQHAPELTLGLTTDEVSDINNTHIEKPVDVFDRDESLKLDAEIISQEGEVIEIVDEG